MISSVDAVTVRSRVSYKERSTLNSVIAQNRCWNIRVLSFCPLAGEHVSALTTAFCCFAVKLEQVLAMFPYTAQNADELTFYKGSVINVMSKEGDWWKGEMNGKIGMFPSNYVQALSVLPVSTTQCK